MEEWDFSRQQFEALQVNRLTLSKTELESQRRRPRECVPTATQYASTARLRSFSPKEAWHNESTITLRAPTVLPGAGIKPCRE